MRSATVLTSWSRALRRALDRAGCNSAALFAQVGLDMAALDDPNARYPLESTTRLWRLAVQATGDPCLGLAVASQVTQTTFHALGYSLSASSTLAEAFERIVRYFRLVTDAAELELRLDGERYRFVIRPVTAPRPADEAIDAFASLFVRMCRSVLGREFSPLRVRLQRAAPATDCFDRVFRAPLEFGCAENELWFAREPFERRLEGANPELARHNDEIALRYLARFDHDNLGARSRAALIERLPLGEPSAERLAEALHLSLRSLQRRLAEEGTSYEKLLTATRRELALSYLAGRRHNISEIAYLLGFSDTSSFTRAFKRWTGQPPSQYGVGTSEPALRNGMPGKP
jgi:AraC-like DNA-binding protein